MGQQETCGVAYDEATLGNEPVTNKGLFWVCKLLPSNNPRKVEIKA